MRIDSIQRAILLCVAFFAVLVWVTVLGMPRFVLLGYAAFSALTYLAYALDKRAAQRGEWRTREATLHLLSLLGGWPGALIAQAVFRHKTRKVAFQAVYWITVGLNCLGLAWAVYNVVSPLG